MRIFLMGHKHLKENIRISSAIPERPHQFPRQLPQGVALGPIMAMALAGFAFATAPRAIEYVLLFFLGQPDALVHRHKLVAESNNFISGKIDRAVLCSLFQPLHIFALDWFAHLLTFPVPLQSGHLYRVGILITFPPNKQ